jgi:hypothetical protein
MTAEFLVKTKYIYICTVHVSKATYYKKTKLNYINNYRINLNA